MYDILNTLIMSAMYVHGKEIWTNFLRLKDNLMPIGYNQSN